MELQKIKERLAKKPLVNDAYDVSFEKKKHKEEFDNETDDEFELSDDEECVSTVSTTDIDEQLRESIRRSRDYRIM